MPGPSLKPWFARLLGQVNPESGAIGWQWPCHCLVSSRPPGLLFCRGEPQRGNRFVENVHVFVKVLGGVAQAEHVHGLAVGSNVGLGYKGKALSPLSFCANPETLATADRDGFGVRGFDRVLAFEFRVLPDQVDRSFLCLIGKPAA